MEELTPDVLLLDVEMPGLKGYEVARCLQAAGAPVRILALSAYDDKQYILAMLASGATGYLTKAEAPQTLVDAVREAVEGRTGIENPAHAEDAPRPDNPSGADQPDV